MKLKFLFKKYMILVKNYIYIITKQKGGFMKQKINLTKLIQERDELELYLTINGQYLDKAELEIKLNILENLDLEIELSKFMTLTDLEDAINQNKKGE